MPVKGWVKRPELAPVDLTNLPEAKRAQAQAMLGRWHQALEVNPLLDIYAHSQSQHDFLASRAFIAAAFSGNQWGKSLSICLLATINCIPREWVPEHLLQYRTYDHDKPFHCRICVPTADKHAVGVSLPQLKALIPASLLEGGGWDRGWNSKSMTVNFKSGSSIEFRSYAQDVVDHAGPARHAVYFDEPPSKPIYEENLRRVLRYKDAHLRFACTVATGVRSWLYKEVYRKKGQTEPYAVDVVLGSSTENPKLDKKQLAASVGASTSKAEVEVRMHGHFVSVEGRIYDSFSGAPAIEGGHVVDNIQPSQLDWQESRIQVNIDPGLRKPAATFWRCNSLKEEVLQFDELYPRMPTMNVAKFCTMILDRLTYWGVPPSQVFFIIDPAAKIRDMRSGEALISEFARCGIYAEPGNNDIAIGIARHNAMIEEDRFAVCRRCEHTIEQYETYSWDDREDDEKSSSKPHGDQDDLLDANRYGTLALPWSGAIVEARDAPPPGSLAAILPDPQITQADQELEFFYA